MEPLVKQLNSLPQRLKVLSTGAKLALGVGLLVAVGLAALLSFGTSDAWQYAYSNLSPDDSAEIAAHLKTAGIAHRFEAGGTALSVPGSKVYDVRLLLATAGLPKSGGAGFELFDKGDFGVSEFTQKINLRRATEGELARTVGRIAGVRSARVHLVLPEKGVFRGDERPASAAVMLTLQPGRVLSQGEIAGVRHLVASAVPALSPQAVTIVDGRGSVLTSDGAWGGELQDYRGKLERDLEGRVVSILEPLVGSGQVVVRVTADVDTADVTSTADVFDPEGAVLKSERTASTNQNQQTPQRGGVAGAAANQPLDPQGVTAGALSKSDSNSQEETRNFELSRTTTRTVQRAPRLTRLSVAVLVDSAADKPRSPEELQRLTELARRAVGFDAARGDQLDLSSSSFTHGAAEEAATVPAPVADRSWVWFAAGGGGLLLLLCLGAVVLLVRRRRPDPEFARLKPGVRISELVAEATPAAPKPELVAPPVASPPALPDPAMALRDRARELAKGDPTRAASLIRSWIALDNREQSNA